MFSGKRTAASNRARSRVIHCLLLRSILFLRPSFLSCLLRSHYVSGVTKQAILPPPHYLLHDGAIHPRSIYYFHACIGRVLRVYCWRTREGSTSSHHAAAANESIDIANAWPWTEWSQLFLGHVGQTAALASENGQGLGCGLVLTATRLDTASVLAPACTQQQGNTHTRGTYRYSV